MANKYRFSLKSEELRGASQPNILYVELASDGDATIFASNLEAVFSADCVTVDSELSTNYALPYPAGSNREFRMVMRDATGIVQTERLYDVSDTTVPKTFSDALIAASGFLILPRSVGGVVTPGGVITSVQVAEFDPTQSV